MTLSRFSALAAILAMLLGTGDCASHSSSSAHSRASEATPGAPTSNYSLAFHAVAVRASRYGVACKSYEYPNALGPASYNVADIGKSGVPPLTEDQLRLLHRIQRYIHSKTIRFVFLGHNHRLALFNATHGPCIDAAPGYWVLNSGHFPNNFYEPGDNPYIIRAGEPPGFAPTPGPWYTLR